MQTVHLDLNETISASVMGAPADVAQFLAEFEHYRLEVLRRRPQHIDVVIAPVPAPTSEHIVVNKKYAVGDDFIYARDRHKVALWQVRIDGLDRDRTRVQLWGNRFARIVWPRWFFETLIRLKYHHLGFSMLHSCTLCDDGGGRVLAASPSTGKTTVLLNWLGAGNPFCSDEYSIFKDGRVYSYVTPFRFHAHNLKRNAGVLAGIELWDRMQIQARTALLKATFGYADVTWKTGLGRTFPNTRIVESCPLRGIYLLTKSQGGEVARMELSADDMATKLLAMNQFEWFGFEPYLRAWAYAHPASWVASMPGHERQILLSQLGAADFAEIHVPREIEQRHYEAVLRATGLTGRCTPRPR